MACLAELRAWIAFQRTSVVYRREGQALTALTGRQWAALGLDTAESLETLWDYAQWVTCADGRRWIGCTDQRWDNGMKALSIVPSKVPWRGGHHCMHFSDLLRLHKFCRVCDIVGAVGVRGGDQILWALVADADAAQFAKVVAAMWQTFTKAREEQAAWARARPPGTQARHLNEPNFVPRRRLHAERPQVLRQRVLIEKREAQLGALAKTPEEIDAEVEAWVRNVLEWDGVLPEAEGND